MLSIKSTSIRFNLTILYSTILIFFSLVIVLGFNIFFTSYLNRDPKFIKPPSFSDQSQEHFPIEEFHTLPGEEIVNIRQVRLNDLQKFREISILSIPPIAILSFILGYIIAGKFLDPIGKLAKKMQTIEADKLGEIIQKTNDDEVGELIDSFNSLSKRLKLSFDEQQRLVQDAAHEIKTPLTIVQTSLDTTLSDKNATRSEMQDAIKDALNGVKRLKKLTNDLLDMTTPNILNEEINLKLLLSQLMCNLKEYARREKVSLKSTTLDDDLVVKGDESKLSRAISNVIENGIKFCAHVKNPTLVVSLQKRGDYAIINIQDNGIGIKEKDLGNIFKRFYRAQKQEEGNGLGLAIAKEIIEQHKGQIACKSRPGKTIMSIEIPLKSN